MKREIHSWHSPSLNKHMDIAVYGHYGFALLMLPTAAADFLEYERFQMLDVLRPLIDAGKVKVFSVNSINSESWMHQHMAPHHKAIRHQQFNHYIYEEVIPFIKSHTSQETPVITTGASLGATHGANLFFKRPDLIDGVIAMSGIYDLTVYTKGFFNDDVYFNSPVHYLPKLDDDRYLPLLRQKEHIHIVTGSGDYEDPGASQHLSNILNAKGISHELDIWGPDMRHDWSTWRVMLPHYIDTRF